MRGIGRTWNPELVDGRRRGVRGALSMLACAGIAASSASAGVHGLIWVEVDNSVATIRSAAGIPTGLEGVRTFDLFAVVTSDTRVVAADFGFVGYNRGFDDNMWTTQSVYQHEDGGDAQAVGVGLLRGQEALEFDTYVGLGMIDTQIVKNTTILSMDWSPAMFQGAWYGVDFSEPDYYLAQGDDEGKLFLARISVSSEGEFGEDTGATEWLGGRVFLGGFDDHSEFGMNVAETGLFVAPNAFGYAAPPDRPAGSGRPPGADDAGSDSTEPTAAFGDVNDDGVVDPQDLLLIQQHFGESGSAYDLSGDGLVDAEDVSILMSLLENGSADIPAPPGLAGDLNGDGVVDSADLVEFYENNWRYRVRFDLNRDGLVSHEDLAILQGLIGPGDASDDLTPKERKQLEKEIRKLEKDRIKAQQQAAKRAAQEAKRLEREQKKLERAMEKARKQALKQAEKARKQLEKALKKQQKNNA
ncbi:MAG: hypothetical protein H6813_06540 [Phycisphaeraceae bacterium]|nr:hypothetical protein [Phycisphaeraceae bacterium]MCB9848130.1 hypothetical protein [Phycisphaeraceae bacterium]